MQAKKLTNTKTQPRLEPDAALLSAKRSGLHLVRLTPDTEDRYEGPRSSDRADSSQSTPERPILLYNGECSVCRRISRWVIESDETKNGGHEAIDERPIGHDPEALRVLNPNLDIWDAYTDIHLLLPDGTIKKGGEAIAEVLRRLPKTAWLGGLVEFKIFGGRPFLAMLEGGYKLLDRLRPALGCESCGGEVPWWAKPISWLTKLVKAIGGKSADKPVPPS